MIVNIKTKTVEKKTKQQSLQHNVAWKHFLTKKYVCKDKIRKPI